MNNNYDMNIANNNNDNNNNVKWKEKRDFAIIRSAKLRWRSQIIADVSSALINNNNDNDDYSSHHNAFYLILLIARNCTDLNKNLVG